MHYSIVIPAYNEEKNIIPIYSKVKQVMARLGEFEIIFVDDGSTDSTYRRLTELSAKDKRVRIIKFRTNFGQTAAMDAGFKHAKGSIIIPIDADLQNDPEDIPRLLAKMKQGNYDCVSGWRYHRQDDFSKKFWSFIARIIRFFIVRDGVHDSGCTMKAYKRECFQELSLYGEMHRYIPALLMWKGFRVGEIKIKHHKRKWGNTKYSLSRLFRGFLDLMVVSFWQRYSLRPIHLFGGIGLLLSGIGGILGLYLLIMRLVFSMPLAGRMLPLLAVIMFIIGLQLFLTGLLADIMIKNYYRDKNTYNIEKII